MAPRVPARLSDAEGRRFGLVLGAAFLALGAVEWWRGHPSLAIAFGVLGGVLVVSGLIIPKRLGPIFGAWMGLAHLISRVTTPVFLGIVFFFVVTPVGLVRRLFGSRPLPAPSAGSSGWIPRDPDTRRRADFQRQF